jgi:hypothetical protein
MQPSNELSPGEAMLVVEAAYGKAMLRAHGLERTLATLLICKATISNRQRAEQDAAIVRIKRLPLGLLIERFETEFSPSEELTEELSNLLYFRNELTHRISDTICNAAMKAHWHEKVTTELNEISGYFADCRPLLQPHMAACQAELGLTDERIEELVLATFPASKIGA